MQSRGDLDVRCKSIESAGGLWGLELLQANVGPGGIAESESFGWLLWWF